MSERFQRLAERVLGSRGSGLPVAADGVSVVLVAAGVGNVTLGRVMVSELASRTGNDGEDGVVDVRGCVLQVLASDLVAAGLARAPGLGDVVMRDGVSYAVEEVQEQAGVWRLTLSGMPGLVDQRGSGERWR